MTTPAAVLGPGGRRVRPRALPTRGARRRTAMVLVALLAAFLATRVVPVVLTLQPQLYGPDVSNPAGDVGRYAAWGTAAIGHGLVPYRDFDVEYPPGALPFVLVPAVVGGGTFSAPVFVGLLVAVDLAAFLLLVAWARRGGSRVGAVAWLVLPPALGVLLYGRLDLLPAVALLAALERAHARRWTSSGVWLGLGAAAKLVPGVFLPVLLVAAGRGRWRLLAGAATGAGVAWLPYAADTPELWHDVIGYHVARGVHLESLWGSLLNLVRLRGAPITLLYEHGAFGITGAGAGGMLVASAALVVGLVVAATAVAVVRWHGRPWRARVELAVAVTATMALLLATTRVFSPQFVVWLLAAAAAALAVTPCLWRWLLPALAAVVALTVLEYPLGFDLLRKGEMWPALALVARNVVVLAVGVACTVRWLRPRGDPWHDGAAGGAGSSDVRGGWRSATFPLRSGTHHAVMPRTQGGGAL